MPKNRHYTKSSARDRNNSNLIQHSNSNRKQMQQSPQIKSILKNVNLNEYMSTVSEVLKSKITTEKQQNSSNEELFSFQGDTSTSGQKFMDRGYEGPSSSKVQVLRKKHVKFSDVVQSFSIGDGWKMSIFVEKLKTEADQQDRSKRLRDNYPHYMTKYNPLPKGL